MRGVASFITFHRVDGKEVPGARRLQEPQGQMLPVVSEIRKTLSFTRMGWKLTAFVRNRVFTIA